MIKPPGRKSGTGDAAVTAAEFVHAAQPQLSIFKRIDFIQFSALSPRYRLEGEDCRAWTSKSQKRLARLGIVALAYDYQGDGTTKTDLAEVYQQLADWTADPTPIVRRSEAALHQLFPAGSC